MLFDHAMDCVKSASCVARGASTNFAREANEESDVSGDAQCQRLGTEELAARHARACAARPPAARAETDSSVSSVGRESFIS
jgi:hypothetical protein